MPRLWIAKIKQVSLGPKSIKHGGALAALCSWRPRSWKLWGLNMVKLSSPSPTNEQNIARPSKTIQEHPRASKTEVISPPRVVQLLSNFPSLLSLRAPQNGRETCQRHAPSGRSFGPEPLGAWDPMRKMGWLVTCVGMSRLTFQEMGSGLCHVRNDLKRVCFWYFLWHFKYFLINDSTKGGLAILFWHFARKLHSNNFESGPHCPAQRKSKLDSGS